jgi:ABC-type dipeptide/oligopeptide/nickel transport system permease subunit
MEDSFGIPKGPNAEFWFGVDGTARDLFVRTMYGTRTSLFIGVVVAGVSVLIGLVVGMAAGFFGGWVDSLLSRAGDVLLAMPQLLIAIGIVAACNTTKQGCLHGLIQPGMTVVIFVIAFFGWPYVARIVRGFTLSLREREFVEASRSLGASNFRIMVREILPNLAGPMIVWTTLLIPQAILTEAALSFLGLGVGQDRIFGTQIYTNWVVYKLLALKPPPGHSWRLGLDYLSDRGPAATTIYNYTLPPPGDRRPSHGRESGGGEHGDEPTDWNSHLWMSPSSLAPP